MEQRLRQYPRQSLVLRRVVAWEVGAEVRKPRALAEEVVGRHLRLEGVVVEEGRLKMATEELQVLEGQALTMREGEAVEVAVHLLRKSLSLDLASLVGAVEEELHCLSEAEEVQHCLWVVEVELGLKIHVCLRMEEEQQTVL